MLFAPSPDVVPILNLVLGPGGNKSVMAGSESVDCVVEAGHPDGGEVKSSSNGGVGSVAPTPHFQVTGAFPPLALLLRSPEDKTTAWSEASFHMILKSGGSKRSGCLNPASFSTGTTSGSSCKPLPSDTVYFSCRLPG